MSEAPEKDSKTEEATSHKLQQAYEKGDGPRTMDLGSAATLAAVSGVVLMAGGWLSSNMVDQLTPFLSRAGPLSVQHGAPEVLKYAIMAGAPPLVLVMFAAAIAGAASGLAQGGLRFTPDKLKPDWSKVSLMKGLERLFGPDGLMQFAKSIVKVIVIAWLGWLILNPVLPQLAALSEMGPAAILPFVMDVTKRLVMAVIALALAVAALDWLWQRQRFMVRMRMTKEEVKEDYKSTEGDPYILARQKPIRYERARRRMMQAVPGATVVVMNPTHYAVALKYEQGADAAPTCVAKGLDSVALKIRSVAEEAGVPVIEDPPLARALYAAVDLDEMIPPAHYEAVAKIIGFILNAGRRRRASAGAL
jgi:flagellar biosynthetic protein FlhB